MPDPHEPPPDDHAPSDHLAGARLGVLSALHDGDAGLAYHLVIGLMGEGYGLAAILEQVLAPIQSETGRRWESGDYSISEEHASTAAAETLVALLAGAFDQPADAEHAVVVCAEGEAHSLPARMAAALLAYEGYRTTFLGAAVPASDLSGFLADARPDALVVSCTRVANLAGARGCVAAAHGAGIPVVVGGRAFGGDDERWRAIGADAHAPSLSALTEVLQTWTPDIAAAEAAAAHPAPMLAPLAAARASVVAAATVAGAAATSASAGDAWLRAGVEELVDTLVAVAHLHDPAVLAGQAAWLADLVRRHHDLDVSARTLLESLASAVADAAPDAERLVAAALEEADRLERG
ncbi:MAG: cobalamin-dependent protein [Acidimicrobiales bacterium]